MKKTRLTYLTIAFFLIHVFASLANPIISGISHNKIDIDTSFNGTTILLFGAQEEAGDILVVVKGPKKNFLINKKDKIFGIWYNKERIEINDAYKYYASFSKNLNEDSSKLIKELKIEKYYQGEKIPKNFSLAFTKILSDKDLYQIDNSQDILFLNETLFKINLFFPKTISQGVYSIEIYLIEKNNLLAFQTIPIYVNKVGFNAKINYIAYNHPYIYAFFVLFLAVLAGWLANFIFNKLFK